MDVEFSFLGTENAHMTIPVIDTFVKRGERLLSKGNIIIGNYDGETFRMSTNHYGYVPWMYDLKWHIDFIKSLIEKYSLTTAIIGDFEFLPYNDVSGFDLTPDQMINTYIQDEKIDPPEWINISDGYFGPFVELKKFMKFLSTLATRLEKVEYLKLTKQRTFANISLPVLVYNVILYGKKEDKRYFRLHYYYDHGLRFEMPTMKALIDEWIPHEKPWKDGYNIPISKLEEIVRIGLEFMGYEHRHEQVYWLIRKNLDRILPSYPWSENGETLGW